MKAVLKNLVTGETIPVHATTDHPDSHYGRPVWVDDNGTAYAEVGVPTPFYAVVEGSITESDGEE